MGGSPENKMRVTQYSASIHYGICHGPVDNITRILVQEKEAWAGTQSSQGSITISNTGLFGGTKKEGGVEGLGEYLPGETTQTIPEILAAKAGRTTATMPAYRGIASIWFYGRNLVEPKAENSPGFYWGANNPYLPGVWVTVSRTSEGLGGGNARIGADSNPAHIIYECLTNTSWGMGASASAIDVDSFTDAAATLQSEAFGLSMIWTRQSTIEAFVSEVLDHIEAVLYVSPRTGLLTLKLIRGDYLGEASSIEGETCVLTWWQTTYEQVVNDEARMGLAFLNTGGSEIGVITWSSFARPAVWTERSVSAVAPAGAVAVRVYMEMRRNRGSNNDGYIDDISLTVGGVAQDMTNPGAESGTTGWINTIGAISTRTAFPDPHSGLRYFMGGTSSTARARQDVSSIVISPLRVFTPDNCTITKFGRKLWGETVNEIIVTFTNASNEEEETVVAQDLANISAQGGIVSDSRNYYGVRSRSLAMMLAQRDLRAASTPLASCEMEANREAWDLEPGDLCILESPEDGIESMVMRVGPVDYGKPGDAVVRASLIEDVFSLGTSDYTVPPETEAEDLSEAPSPLDFTLVLTASWHSVINEVDPAISSIEYPEVFAAVLGAEDGPDTIDFDLYGEVVDAGGNTTVQDIGTKTITGRSELPDALVAEVETVISDFGTRTRGNGPVVGGFVLFEGDGEDSHELCLILSVGGSPSAWTLRRGVLDTIPRAWPVGTPVWFIDASLIWIDQTVRAAGEIVDYQMLPRTSLGQLSLIYAPVVSHTLTARPYLPFRPAAVTIDLDDGLDGLPIDLTNEASPEVAFARRNRLTEDALILAWDDADVTPEAGQTTTVRLLDLSENVLHSYTGISGTSQIIDKADFAGEEDGYVEVTAVRDGLESLQPYRVRVIVSRNFNFEDGTLFEFENGEQKEFED